MRVIEKTRLATSVAALAVLTAVPALAQMAPVEVIHNLTTAQQQPSVQMLIEEYEALGGTWIDSPIAGGATARAAAVNRAVAGDPAEVMYVPAKLMFEELIDAGLAVSVAPDGWEEWEATVPASIWREIIGPDGYPIVTPVVLGIHNMAFFNTRVLQQAGALMPQTWEELLDVLEQISAVDGVIPLSFSGTPAQMFQTIHNITAGVGGVELYNRIFVDLDPEAFHTEEFHAVADVLRRLKPYTDPGSGARTWQQAGDLVASGQAGAQVLGTFAQATFVAADLEIGPDYQCAVLNGVAILGPNSFMYGRPDNDAEREAQNVFAAMIMDPRIQADHAASRGGVPPRLDAPRDDLDECAVAAIPAMSDPNRNVLDPALTMSPTVTGAVTDVIVEFWANDEMTIEHFAAELADTVASLR